jgi:OOP family OmpA-OmpF porin
MRTLGLLAVGLAGIGLLTYFCGVHHGPHFAADLSAKTGAALKSVRIDPVEVTGEGQILTLRGQVASEEIKARAEAEAKKIDGVEAVVNLLTVAPPAPAVPAMSAQERKEAVSCQTEFNRLLRGEKIRFDTSSDAVSRASHRLLDRLAAAAAKCPTAQIVIEGHTDSRGAHGMNMGLSRRRAAAVEKYLEAKGVPAASLTSEGFGPDKPAATNDTPAGREINRRTEFRVKGL